MIIFEVDPGKKINKFLKWIEDNPEGFYVYCQGEGEQMVHRAPCKHVRFPEFKARTVDANLMQNIKVCSHDLNELAEWVKQERPGRLAYCRFCKPDVVMDY